MAKKKSPIEIPGAGVVPAVKLAKKLPEKAQALIIGIFASDDGVEVPASAALDGDALRTVLDQLLAVGATGKAGSVHRIPAPEEVGTDSIVAVGLGEAEQLDDETLRRAAGCAARAAQGLNKVGNTLHEFGLAAAVEGTILGGYVHRGLRSDKLPADKKPATVSFLLQDKKDAATKNEFNAARAIAQATVFARDLVNCPSNELYPSVYADILSSHATAAGLGVEVLDEKQLKKEGFGGILSVGQGSARPPRLVRLSWKPSKAKRHVALVGKGITFDTGGISLKPGAGMWDMIMDMGGSAAVAAATLAAAYLKLDVAVTATIPLAENMPSGSATRPGDVITHYGGTTSEVLNTDAEGRLVLADAIARASEDKPDYLIDTATLTGAQMVALGKRTAGVMGTEEFRDEVANIGRRVGENAWAVPLLEEHNESLKSDNADIRNINAQREGGMQFAGTYLEHFVGEGIDWAHIDVAGPAWNGDGARGYTPKRATGVPTRTIIAVLEQVAGAGSTDAPEPAGANEETNDTED
ncbi:leucyl aminopeptidase [Corynebacterium sp. LK2590]